MKKLFTVLVVTVFAACGSGSSAPTATDSSTIVKSDSTTIAVPDSSKMKDTTKKMESKMSDSKMTKDSTKK